MWNDQVLCEPSNSILYNIINTMCRFFSCRYPGKTHVHTTEDILLTESEDSFREAAEADSVEDISLTNSFISRVSFMDAIESINTRSCYFCIHVENIYLSLHRSNRRPGMYRCWWLSHLQGVLQGSCQASLYKPGIYICMWYCFHACTKFELICTL